MSSIKLIVGLANPGQEYAMTRHNAGAWFVESLARRAGATLTADKKMFGLTTRVTWQDHDLRLLIPTTFMNASGQSVAAIANFYKIQPNEMLIAHDDLDLLPGNARFKLGGGHGGHNGLRDIIQSFGQEKGFYRLRIGIGHPGHKSQVSSFVLSKAPVKEQSMIVEAVDEAVDATQTWLNQDFERAMHRLHTFKAQASELK